MTDEKILAIVARLMTAPDESALHGAKVPSAAAKAAVDAATLRILNRDELLRLFLRRSRESLRARD